MNVLNFMGKSYLWALTGLLLLTAVACSSTYKSSPNDPVSEVTTAKLVLKVDSIDLEEEPIQPIPSIEEFFEDNEIDYDAKKIALGKRIFHDPRLSHDNTLSCAGCHDLRYGGIDRAITATGIRAQIGPINTPTVFNSAFNINQFWDGRAKDLEAQADGPPNASGEMGSNWKEITAKFAKDLSYFDEFSAVFPDIKAPADISATHIQSAIADFERTLITPNGSFDKYLNGDSKAVSQNVKEGYQLFKDIGCSDCHYGVAVGTRAYQRLGHKVDYFSHTSESNPVDRGRFNVTKDKRDLHVFKVPTLRNVELTAPYFHNGSQKTLAQAVKSMGKYQLGVELDGSQVSLLVEFLNSLTGEYEGKKLSEHQNTH